MKLLITSVVLTIVIAIALIILIRQGIKKRILKVKHYGLSLLALIILPIVIFTGSIVKISANEVGIIYDDRYGLIDQVKREGYQFKSIFEHITKISTSYKTQQLEVAGQTSDSAYAMFIITVVYQIEPENAGLFYKKTNAPDLSSEQLNSVAKEALQGSTIKFDIYSILGEKLETVRLDFVESLRKTLQERYHLTLISASFDDVDAGERIENIIKNKAEALQEIEIAEAEQQRVMVEAITMKIKAEAEAEVERIKSDAQAYNVEVQKQTVIDMIDAAYEKYQDQLTYQECAEIVLQILFIQSWDGKLPEVLTSDSLASLIGSLITGNNNDQD